jgi:hypothetical protein
MAPVSVRDASQVPQMNSVIFDADASLHHDIQTLDKDYRSHFIYPHTMEYGRLIYQWIFSDSHGRSGPSDPSQWKKTTTLMRKSIISLIATMWSFPPQLVHNWSTLREESICSMCGRLSNINIQYRARSENLTREDEIREEIPDEQAKEFGK